MGSLLNHLQQGQYVIPDFQRDFEWNPWDVKELLKSIFMDYYIGTLLLWKGKKENFHALSCENIYGYEGEYKPTHIVLDGQQRLTAIYYASFSPRKKFPKRKSRCFFYLKIDEFVQENFDDAFEYDWITKRWKKIIENQEEMYERHIFPIALLGGSNWDLIRWLGGYKSYWADKKAEIEDTDDEKLIKRVSLLADGADYFYKYVEELMMEYHISYIELDEDIGVEKVCDIFTQINSRGVRLDIFDLLNAMLRPKDIYLKAMWRDVAPRLNFVDTGKMNVYILQVMSILLQAYCSPKYLYFLLPGNPKVIRETDGSTSKVTLVETKEDFLEYWKQAVSTLESSMRVLNSPQDYGAISSSYIPYPAILPAFAALRHKASARAPMEFNDAHRKIRKWYWASVFTNRYSSAAESTSARDYRDVKAWFEDDAKEPQVIGEFEERFHTINFREETRKNSAIYIAVFNLMVIKGAKDWVTNEMPHHEGLDDHHIVPSSWGVDKVGQLIHSVLNRTPLSEDTNRKIIRSRLPNEYLPEMIEKYGRDIVIRLLSSHLISEKAMEILMRSDFAEADYEEFIEERLSTVRQAIQDLLIHERIEVPLDLRELDDDVERTELAIRKCIFDAIGEDPSTIPDHILQRINERIERALMRMPNPDPVFFETTKGKLEYFDLRECQELITNKAMWDRFSRLFGNKEVLNIKFTQLAELRNTIRHSRILNDVIRMEGEAAVKWFKGILG